MVILRGESAHFWPSFSTWKSSTEVTLLPLPLTVDQFLFSGGKDDVLSEFSDKEVSMTVSAHSGFSSYLHLA